MLKTKKVRYEKKCDECGSPFVASMKNAKFCSGACRARYSREKKEAKYQGVIKLQSKAIKAQEKVIKKYDWWEKEQKRKAEHDVWLDKVLSGIVMPSISRYKAGTWTEYEIKEFSRVAQIQGKTIDEYMKDLEASLLRMHPDIAKQFE